MKGYFKKTFKKKIKKEGRYLIVVDLDVCLHPHCYVKEARKGIKTKFLN
jgi:hypothetical protein